MSTENPRTPGPDVSQEGDEPRRLSPSKKSSPREAKAEFREMCILGKLNRHWYRRCLDISDCDLRECPPDPRADAIKKLCQRIITGFLEAVIGQAPDSLQLQFPADRSYFITFEGRDYKFIEDCRTSLMAIFAIYVLIPGNAVIEHVLLYHTILIRWILRIVKVGNGVVQQQREDFSQLFESLLKSIFPYGQKIIAQNEVYDDLISRLATSLDVQEKDESEMSSENLEIQEELLHEQLRSKSDGDETATTELLDQRRDWTGRLVARESPDGLGGYEALFPFDDLIRLRPDRSSFWAFEAPERWLNITLDSDTDDEQDLNPAEHTWLPDPEQETSSALWREIHDQEH